MRDGLDRFGQTITGGWVQDLPHGLPFGGFWIGVLSRGAYKKPVCCQFLLPVAGVPSTPLATLLVGS